MQTSGQPYLTNDVSGVLKLVFTIILPVVLSIIGAVWKFMRGDLKADINGLGNRVGTVEAVMPRVVLLEQQKLADAQQFTDLSRSRGSMEATIAQLQEAQTDGKLEIIARINDMQIRIETRINEQSIQVAELRGEMRQRNKEERGS